MVVSATLQLFARYQSGFPIDLAIAGDDQSSAQDFYGGAREISNRPRTTSVVSWTLTSRVNGWLNSPDLTSIVQEILSRPDWRSGNNLALLIDPAPDSADYATWTAFEGNPELAARLLIRFRAPDTPTPTATPTATPTMTPSPTPTGPVTKPHKIYLPLIMNRPTP